jgi:H+-transporting ATPase
MTSELKEPEHKEVVADIEPELEALLQTNPLTGLSDAQVQERLDKFGPNCNL